MNDMMSGNNDLDLPDLDEDQLRKFIAEHGGSIDLLQQSSTDPQQKIEPANPMTDNNQASTEGVGLAAAMGIEPIQSSTNVVAAQNV